MVRVYTVYEIDTKQGEHMLTCTCTYKESYKIGASNSTMRDRLDMSLDSKFLLPKRK